MNHNIRFLLRWMLFCTTGEFLGLSAAAGFFYAMQVLGEEQPLALFGLAVLCGIAEGGILGWMQWLALKERYGITSFRWITATIMGAVSGWMLGMIPATVIIIMQMMNKGAETADKGKDGMAYAMPALGYQLLLGAAIGLSLGAILGAIQYAAFKKHALKAGRWIWANAAGWALGMPLVFIFASLPAEDSGIWTILAAGGAGGFAAGMVVGTVTGLMLLKIPSRKTIYTPQKKEVIM